MLSYSSLTHEIQPSTSPEGSHGSATRSETITHISTKESSLWTRNNYLRKELAAELLSYFTSDDCPLTTDPSFKSYGKVNIMHRRVGFYSDTVDGYPFSKQVQLALPLTNTLKSLMTSVNDSLGTEFNSVLVNHYRDGKDSIGRHSDNESTLSNGIVVGISLGVPRIFRIRKVGEKSPILVDILTEHNQLLVMDGKFQREFTHEIPVRIKEKGDRVSLTFRAHCAPRGTVCSAGTSVGRLPRAD